MQLLRMKNIYTLLPRRKKSTQITLEIQEIQGWHRVVHILKKWRERCEEKNKYAYFKWEFIFLLKHHWESSWSKQNPAVITQMANSENIVRQRGPSFLDIMPISLYMFSHIYSYWSTFSSFIIPCNCNVELIMLMVSCMN